MYLKSLTLKDWKQYVSAKFDFSAVNSRKNIVLVGAKNGYGKTGLFEAFVLGLFGRDGLPLIARAPFSGGEEDKLQTSYSQFLEKAINGHAVKEGRLSCYVQFVFEDEDGVPIEIKRTWNFSSNGAFVNPRMNEDVQIFRGISRDPVGPDTDEQDGDRLRWYRDYIAQAFVPANLAAFFVFDGERVGEFADREMSAQVKIGIQGLLGLPILKDLARDLRNYAGTKRVPTKVGESEDLQDLQNKAELIETQIEELETDKETKELTYRKLSKSVDELTVEISGFGFGTQAETQDLIQRGAELRRQFSENEETIKRILKDDLSLAILSSSELGKRLTKQLYAERARETWLSGKSSGEKRLSAFVEMLKSQLEGVDPKLQPGQVSQLEDAVDRSWSSLWHPEPTECSAVFRHSHLTGLDREKTISLIERSAQFGAGQLIEAFDVLANLRNEIERNDEQVSRLQLGGPQLEEIKRKLTAARSEQLECHAAIQSLENNLTGLQGTLDTLKKTIARITQLADSKLPDVRRAQRAQRVAAMIDELVEYAVPGQVAQVSDEMTSAFKALAHKSEQVTKVEVTADCEVRLYNKAGRDLRDYDLSAGEKQIFTQALISAIVSVSGKNFPLLIDTPLGRLDEEHRINVLKHLMKRKGQVILLSSPTEVVGPYFEVIEPKLAKAYTIKFEGTEDMGISRPVEGYFEG